MRSLFVSNWNNKRTVSFPGKRGKAKLRAIGAEASERNMALHTLGTPAPNAGLIDDVSLVSRR